MEARSHRLLPDDGGSLRTAAAQDQRHLIVSLVLIPKIRQPER
jgi:hypothetical protein